MTERLALLLFGLLLLEVSGFVRTPKLIVFSQQQRCNNIVLYAISNELGDEDSDNVTRRKSWDERLKRGLKWKNEGKAEGDVEKDVINEEDIQKELIEAGKLDVEKLIMESRNIALSDVVGAQGDEEDEILDLNLISETALDQSIERAVRQLLDEGVKAPEKAPIDVFNDMYLNLKNKNSKNNTSLDPAAMLAQLFPGEQKKNPFDERKVMIKLRQMLDKADFDDLFLDPSIGDWL